MPPLRYMLIIVLVAISSYGLLEAMPILSGPSLAISSPTNGKIANNGLITVSGKVERVVALTLDGVPLLPENDGSFSKVVTPPLGGSIIRLTASDRFGHTVTDTRTIFTK